MIRVGKNPLYAPPFFILCLFLVTAACASRPAKPDEAKELPYLSEKEEIKFGNYVDAVVRSQYPIIKDASNGALEKDYFLLIQNNLPVRKTYKWLEDAATQAGEADKEVKP